MTSLSLFGRASVAIVLSSALALAGCSSTATSTSNTVAGRPDGPVSVVANAEEKRRAAKRTGEVYLMRGLMDIFSRGIDEMAVQMRRQGLYAVDTSYTEWENIGYDIVRRAKRKDVSYPIIIVGHSLGANDATKLANYLGQRGIKVSLVVAFDPTEPGYVGKNVKTVINYYIPNENNKIYRRKGFKGRIINVDMSDNPDITHTTVEKDPGLQAKVISRVMKLTRRKKR